MLEASATIAPTVPATGRRGAAITSVAISTPATVAGNGPIAERLGVSERWIVARTGVEERRIAAPGEGLVAYAADAGGQAVDAAGVDARDLDLVLVATMTHEQLTPNAAPLVAAELGATRAGAIDVGAACSGFLSALALATAQIDSARAQNVLVIGADLMSRVIDRDDRSTAALFGDGAGAVVLRSTAAPGRIGPVVLRADGSRGDLVRASRQEAVLRMNGHDTFRQAVDRLAETTLEAIAAAGCELIDVDLFVYHQANSRIIRAVGERLGLLAERVVDSVPRYGNTSAASIPLALAEAQDDGRLPDGARVLIAAFGGGLTWGATLVEWGESDA
ncbi:MAG TPA: beta-ketoacyl-ACP synthase 3 [Solirubrobacterales bacterium]|jgi:3-oxoacyl-[acyl-carrier-protein] synthase-3|nr:beta-ketoacyl-ACP synthase 3 [Solirubrobacterales bacterium]